MSDVSKPMEQAGEDAVLSAPAIAARPPHAVSVSLTYAWRALLKIKHMPEQLFDVVVTPIMFTVMFTYLFGGALAGSTDAYLQFLLPGILVQTIVFTSVYTGFTLNTDISKGVFDRFRSLPVWSPGPIAGAMLADVFRFTASGVIVFIVGTAMGYRPEGGFIAVIPALLLMNAFAFGFGWIFTALALSVRTPSTVMTLAWLVLMPLTFASNIYVDPATMPGWLQAVVAVNPVTLLVTAIREIMAGAPDVRSILLALLAPGVIAGIFGPITMWLYRKER
jgi:ABC-2 type transport system permease protein